MKKIIKTEKAPAAIGPYSQAIAANGMLYVSGQIPINPATNEVVLASIEEQTRLVLNNLKAILQAGGSSLAQVVKTTIFATNLDDFAKINAVYGEFFAANPPARATVQVAKLPKGVNVEIEAIAAL